MRRHLYYYTLLSGFRTASGLLAASPGAWLPAPATPEGSSWSVLLNAEGVLPASLAAHLAEVEVGAAHGTDTVTVPVGWHSGRADRLLPVFEGELELSHLEGDAAHLSLLGSYRPPLSVVGEVGDRVLGHRIAEACVRRFVLEVAGRLEAAAVAARPT